MSISIPVACADSRFPPLTQQDLKGSGTCILAGTPAILRLESLGCPRRSPLRMFPLRTTARCLGPFALGAHPLPSPPLLHPSGWLRGAPIFTLSVPHASPSAGFPFCHRIHPRPSSTAAVPRPWRPLHPLCLHGI